MMQEQALIFDMLSNPVVKLHVKTGVTKIDAQTKLKDLFPCA
jgi:hypothetical protein